MLIRPFLATTALVLCVSATFAAGAKVASADKSLSGITAAQGGRQLAADFRNTSAADANAQFLAWYGKSAPHGDSTLLYEQSAPSGFAKYAIASWKNDSAAPYGDSGTAAADDFIIPGTGTHAITAVYAEGVIEPEDDLAWVNVIFYERLSYDRKNGMTTATVKAECPYMPFTDTTGTGDLMVDVSSCNTGAFKAGHDYAVSVQPESADLVWYWQTNKKRVGRPGFWYDYYGGKTGACYTQLAPIKKCYPTKGYGPDLAFAIYGN